MLDNTGKFKDIVNSKLSNLKLKTINTNSNTSGPPKKLPYH